MQRDSIANTIVVSLVLCLICATLVSVAAVGLKPFQQVNIERDRKRNILEVTGFSATDIKAAGSVEALFEKRFETEVIGLKTGQPALDELKEALAAAQKDYGDDVKGKYDQYWASKSKKKPITDFVPKNQDLAGIKFREKFSHVFILKGENDQPEKYIFPVRGYGLWSMMRGYLALEPDFQTVAGLTFYEHGETPGLGGEIENPNWKSYWHGKKVYDPNTGEVSLQVVKGKGSGDYEIDGLSGATITAQGVSSMIKYWMGPEGFGPYIDQKLGRTSKSDASESKEVNEESKEPASKSKEAALQSAGGNQHG